MYFQSIALKYESHYFKHKLFCFDSIPWKAYQLWSSSLITNKWVEMYTFYDLTTHSTLN